jgi:DNA polymerase III delta prime subunit
MARSFNTAGPCNPGDHYMLPPEGRLPQLRQLIDQKLYFVVHAPRQTGKTTIFRALARQLAAEQQYIAVHASCERGQAAGSDVNLGIQAILRVIEEQTEELACELSPRLKGLDGVSKAKPRKRPISLLFANVGMN